MKFKLILLGILIIILTNFCIAEYPGESNPLNFTQCYNLNQGSGEAIDQCNGYNATLNGTTSWNATGKFSGSVYYTSSGAWIETIGSITDLNVGDNISVSTWYKQSTVGFYRGILDIGNNVDASQFHIVILSNNKIRVGMWQLANGGGYRYWDSTAAITTDLNDYHHLFFQMTIGTEGTSVLKIDNTTIGGAWGGDALTSPYGATTSMRIGSNNAATSSLNGNLDDFLLGYNTRLLDDDEINQIYVDGFPGQIDIYSLPEDDTQYSTNSVNFNATIEASIAGTFNCSLYLNGVNNYSWTNQANTTTFINTSLILTTPSTNTYYFNCTDGATETISSTKTFYLDIVNPAITTDFVNGKFYYAKNLTGQFNFSDDFLLYSYNISIDGTQIDGATALNTSSYSYNLSYNHSSLVNGLHTLTVKTADGHTAKSIPDYGVKDGWFNSYLAYTFPEQTSVTITEKDGGILDEFTTEKKLDRYTFDYVPQNKKNKYTFTVTSEEPMELIRTDSKYQEYLIIGGKHWLDFVMEEESDHKVKVNMLSPYEAEVDITGFKSNNKLRFSSLGDLNIIEQNYTFTKINATVTYVDPATETQEHNAALRFNITGMGLTTANFTKSLLYDGTAGTILTTTDGTTYINYQSTLTAPTLGIGATNEQVPFNWTFAINGDSESILFNHSVYAINIGDCADHVGDNNWTEALNFISLNEEGNATEYVNQTTLNIDLNVWFEDEDAYRDFSFGFSGDYNYSLCIYPNSSTYNVSATMEYYAPNYANRKYYLDNYQLDNETQTIQLYNINSSKASDITLYVYDKNTAEPVSEAYVKILRYYPENGSYRVVEIEKTDNNGYSLAKMVLADVFYKFIVETDRTVRLSTNVERIISLTKNLGITQGGDALESWRLIDNVNTQVACVNATKTCFFTWSDTENIVQTATLKVFKLNSYGRSLLSTQSDTASAGTLVYTITEDTEGNQYSAVGYIDSTTENSLHTIGEAVLNYYEGMHQIFGVSALFPILLLIIAVAAAFADVGAVAIVGGSLFALVALALIGIVNLGFFTITSIIVIAGILIAKMRA